MRHGPVDDLVALVKRLVRALEKSNQDKALQQRAMDYLRCNGLLGSPLRDQITDDGNDGVSWCSESVGGAEVEYIRGDLVRSLVPGRSCGNPG